jgi:hypothetical protein
VKNQNATADRCLAEIQPAALQFRCSAIAVTNIYRGGKNR